MTTTDIDLSALLARLHACSEARDWSAGKTLEQAWAECPRGDWMLWLAGHLDIDRKVLVRAACACARLALPFVPADETRPLKAIEAAEAWTRGEATIEDVRAARVARVARAAALAAAAACAAAEAAWACAAAEAAWAVAYAAVCAAAEAARGAALASKLAECADIVRKHVPYELIAEAARREARLAELRAKREAAKPMELSYVP